MEFDVIATNTFEWHGQHVYASEEYPEFIGDFNDPIAIFVSTNQGRTGWNDPAYPTLADYAAPDPVFSIEYDGMTILLTALTALPANVTNHIKIVIADYADEGDYTYDSTVFISTWSAHH